MRVDIQYPDVYFTLLILHLLITMLMLSDVVKYNSLSYYMCNCEPILLTKSGTEHDYLRKANTKKQAAEPRKNHHNQTRKKSQTKHDREYHFWRLCYLQKHDVRYCFSSKRKKKHLVI